MMKDNNRQDSILLFVPGYNCEKQITRVLDQLDSEVLSYISKVIMVNNRSTDNTEQAVIDYAKNHKELDIALIRNDENYILGGSHKVAFEYAISGGFDYMIVLHGDDQGDIHDILPILKSGEYRQFDCCLGARFMKGAKLQGYSGLRTAANIMFNLWFSLVTFRKIKDLGSGLNLYKIEAIKNRYYLKYPDKLFFNDVMVLASAYYKQKVKFFPIIWKEDDQVSNVKLFNFGKELLRMSFLYIFKRKSFMRSEMREHIISDYTYKIIFENKA